MARARSAALRSGSRKERHGHGGEPGPHGARASPAIRFRPAGDMAGFILAVFIVAVIAAVIAVLASPDILTAGFWRTQGNDANSVAKAPDPPAQIAPAPVAPAPVAPAARPDCRRCLCRSRLRTRFTSAGIRPTARRRMRYRPRMRWKQAPMPSPKQSLKPRAAAARQGVRSRHERILRQGSQTGRHAEIHLLPFQTRAGHPGRRSATKPATRCRWILCQGAGAGRNAGRPVFSFPAVALKARRDPA